VLSGMQYPHWLMVAGVVLVVLGSVGLAFQQRDHKDGNGDEREEVNDEDQAPTRVKHRQGD
jgi:Sec-independent protein translocase protein TatA